MNTPFSSHSFPVGAGSYGRAWLKLSIKMTSWTLKYTREAPNSFYIDFPGIEFIQC